MIPRKKPVTKLYYQAKLHRKKCYKMTAETVANQENQMLIEISK
jgi:hypothetical protein